MSRQQTGFLRFVYRNYRDEIIEYTVVEPVLAYGLFPQYPDFEMAQPGQEEWVMHAEKIDPKWVDYVPGARGMKRTFKLSRMISKLEPVTVEA